MERTNLDTVETQAANIGTREIDGKYLTFWTDNQLFGISIANVVQIVGMQKITEVPEYPDYAKGIINLRGAIIPLIDARLRLGKEEIDYNERTCVIVTDISNSSIGFIVDEVDAVMIIDDDLISPPPKLAGASEGYITGIGKLENKVVLIIDTQKLIGMDELNVLTNV
ncbi:MAG: chemotaxis protein CheW [Oscillospiraceae bacterium]